MHAASHTTCAIRSVKRVQMSSLCVAGVQSESCYLIPTAEPSDCSSRPVCVTHKYSITLRLASFSPDLHLQDICFKQRNSPHFSSLCVHKVGLQRKILISFARSPWWNVWKCLFCSQPKNIKLMGDTQGFFMLIWNFGLICLFTLVLSDSGKKMFKIHI